MIIATLIAGALFVANNQLPVDAIAKVLPKLSNAIAVIEALPNVTDDEATLEIVTAKTTDSESTPVAAAPKEEVVVEGEVASAPEGDLPDLVVSLEHPTGICEEVLEPIAPVVTEVVAEASPEATPDPVAATENEIATDDAAQVSVEAEESNNGVESSPILTASAPTEPTSESVVVEDANSSEIAVSAENNHDEYENGSPVPATLAASWPHLSEHTRAAIMMLLEADRMTRD